MTHLALNEQETTCPLWGLIRDDRYSDQTGPAFGCLFSKSHYCDGECIEGLLLFTSPMHAEIYRLWLQSLGNVGWRRFCVTDDDIQDIIGNLRDERLQLWIVAGFAASETQQLLLDEHCLLMTSSLGIDFPLSRREGDDGTALRLPYTAIRVLQEFSPEGASIRDADMPTGRLAADDEVWEEDASEALERIAKWQYVDYKRGCGTERPAVALAQFDRITGKWLFIGGTANQCH